MRVGILTISDSVSSGDREDRSGAAVAESCQGLGWEVVSRAILPDDEARIADQLIRLADVDRLDLVLTVGGTGLGPRDRTPEATARVAERMVPGLGECMRASGAKTNPHALLSRSLGACRGRTLILNLPGSPRGAVESFQSVAELLPHAIEILHGAGHDGGSTGAGKE
ncbi:MAG TPA: MogA/MoaB family molybdenum cofactor biosynthesis protein [Candidatus Dormibacteraeota bacterium]|nr:MogA/MoaB family molybdenum cofactor biosynthesis protein [Candidatus Dormibacteraeota bacterium]